MRRFSHPTWLASAALLGLCAAYISTASASPESSLQVRTVLLGTDGSSYYTLTTERRNHGSYYELDDSLFVNRTSFTGRLLDRRLLRAITRRSTSPGESNRWVSKESSPSFDLQSYLKTRALEPAMPSDALAPCALLLDSLSLSLRFGKNSELLVPRPMAGVEVEEGELELVEYFVPSGSIPGVRPGPSGHVLVLLRAGEPGYEGDYREAVLVIPWTRIDAAMSRVWKE
jgi:hypothetical protein